MKASEESFVGSPSLDVEVRFKKPQMIFVDHELLQLIPMALRHRAHNLLSVVRLVGSVTMQSGAVGCKAVVIFLYIRTKRERERDVLK